LLAVDTSDRGIPEINQGYLVAAALAPLRIASTLRMRIAAVNTVLELRNDDS
jgi:hypothetical protein